MSLPTPIRRVLLALAGMVFSGCSDQSVTVDLRSLQSSEDVSYVCRATDQTPGHTRGDGLPLSECHAASLVDDRADLYALVTQTSTGEVAVINVPFDADDRARDEGVVDLDISTPGFGFARVGARPTDIVSTPGGSASFVTVAEIGSYGVFGLPTSCLEPPASGAARDLTTWPACRLRSAPGNIELLRDPAQSCPRVAPETRDECPTDLTVEAGTENPYKLLVSLPDDGSLVVIDAQWLLNQPLGTFSDCQIDAEYALSAALPVSLPEQRLPSDLNECARVTPPQPPPPSSFTARPSDLAHGDGLLYVSDASAPLVHVLEVSRPCAAAELPPLVPRSFDAPERVVRTTGVSLSPLTPSGKRFLYAIDEDGTVMVFDVSSTSIERTPLVRPGAPWIPFEAPDRLAFGGAVQDVTFFVRDRPVVDPETGVAIGGELCDPNPESQGPGTQYRPRNSNGEFSAGARAAELRGVFAAVALSRGGVTFVDVEDFDAPCRRPVSGNSASVEDFRGCVNDPVAQYSSSAGSTVTGEVSCRMVTPHRQRSARLGITSTGLGVRAPSLSAFPQLTVPESAAQSSLAQRPKLLAVSFPAPDATDEDGETPAEVFVGTTLYVEASNENPAPVAELVTDPTTARQHSVALPYNEPRAYLPRQSMALSYEGPVAELSSGFLSQPDALLSELVLRDGSANYCDRGVHDAEVMRELGAERFGLEGDALERFATRHSDYVMIRSDFPDEDETGYWDEAACTRRVCEQVFGEADADPLLAARDFTIVDADQNRLRLEPREVPADAGTPVERAALAACCFPTGLSYAVRASQHWVVNPYRHDVVADPATLNCVRDCNPRKRFFDSRVFEIAAPTCDGEACSEVCVLNDAAGGVALAEPAARCIHDSATARFAVYRGTQASQRDMVFTWDTQGGFEPMSLNLSILSANVLPQSVVGLRDLDWLTVVDAESLGLTVLDLNDLSILTPTLN